MWWVWVLLVLTILALFASFIMVVAAVFNWMHAGTADFWEVAGFKKKKTD